MLKLAAVFVVALNAFAGEYAILASGFEMRVDRHEAAGNTVKLYANGGCIEMPASDVVRFVAEYVPPAPAAAPPAAPVDARQLVSQEATRWGIPPSLLNAIAKTESGYDPAAVSPKGAVGVMQLMPDTARQLGADPRDPRQNVAAGTRYFVDLLRKYRQDPYQVRKAVAAYNAGPAAVDRYNGVPPYQETREYVRRVVKQWNPRPAKSGPATLVQ